MLRRSTNELSIRPKFSMKAIIVMLVAGAIVLVALLYFAYLFGIKSGHQQYDADKLIIANLNGTISELRAQLGTDENGLIFAQRQHQIQQEAYKQLSNAYANSEKKNRELGSRLDFYRSIISPLNAQSGPAIQAFNSRVEDSVVSFDVTLVQAIKHKHQVRGNLRVSLYEGEQLLGQWPVSSARSVSYQYFERVSGAIEAPNFNSQAPLKLRVEFDLKAGEKLEQWYDLELAS